MKALLLKDWYLSVKYYKVYYLLTIAFLLASVFTEFNTFLTFYPFMLLSMMSIGLQNVDENTHWDLYCCAMPCTKAQMVSEKYVFGLLPSLVAWVLLLICQGLRMGLKGNVTWGDLSSLASVSLTIILLLPSISLPLIFRFGGEKGRIAQYVLIGIVFGGAVAVNSTGGLSASASPFHILPWLLTAVMAVLYGLSWLFSIRFYQAREIK